VSKVYNRNFKAGVALTIVIFVLLNIGDYIYRYSSYHNSPIKFSPGGFLWGIPFAWFRNDASGIEPMLNGLTIAILAIGVGFISKLIFDKAE
jgi:hypothetical protein